MRASGGSPSDVSFIKTAAWELGGTDDDGDDGVGAEGDADRTPAAAAYYGVVRDHLLRKR